MFTESPEHLEHLGILVLGEQVYLKIEVISLLRLDAASVLTHENEEGEKNRFKRNDQGQE